MPEEQTYAQIRTLSRAGCTELFASATARVGVAPESVLEPLARAAARTSAQLVSLDTYGLPTPEARWDRTPGCHLRHGPMARDLTGGKPVPHGLVPRGPVPQESLPHVAAQLWAIAGTEVAPVMLGGLTVGTSFADGQARYVRLGGMLPADTQAPPAAQARQVFEQLDAALRTCQMSFRSVVRTWFYNREILAWYDEFNAVRNGFFAEHELDWQCLPASTGVGAGRASRAALVGSLLAIEPLRPDSHVQVAAVPSPRQGPAPDYGSAFSRAVEIVAPDHRRLLISGTASIDEQGRTLHVGEVGEQVRETFDIVRRLLESRGMSWANVVRGIAYFRRAKDIPALEEYVARQGLPPIHVLPVIATVCRDELLFELEIDAAVAAQGA
jgi:enamine deaminase RidA (YjgF/YER057c/UK114 family)